MDIILGSQTTSDLIRQKIRRITLEPFEYQFRILIGYNYPYDQHQYFTLNDDKSLLYVICEIEANIKLYTLNVTDGSPISEKR